MYLRFMFFIFRLPKKKKHTNDEYYTKDFSPLCFLICVGTLGSWYTKQLGIINNLCSNPFRTLCTALSVTWLQDMHLQSVQFSPILDSVLMSYIHRYNKCINDIRYLPIYNKNHQFFSAFQDFPRVFHFLPIGTIKG